MNSYILHRGIKNAIMALLSAEPMPRVLMTVIRFDCSFLCMLYSFHLTLTKFLYKLLDFALPKMTTRSRNYLCCIGKLSRNFLLMENSYPK